ncbi:hypothetical protein D3C72_2359700 [compost metagenome]
MKRGRLSCSLRQGLIFQAYFLSGHKDRARLPAILSVPVLGILLGCLGDSQRCSSTLGSAAWAHGLRTQLAGR